MMKKIIVATKNQGKIKEMINAFKNLPVELHSLSEFGPLPDAVEDGTTFEENAIKKAKFYAQKTGYACLADDYSARFAGYHADDLANNKKMIEELQKKNVEQSTAQYVCSLVFVDTDGKTLTCTQKCEGIIRIFAQGNNGFGYDPYFFVPDLQKTMAELTIEEKNNISHRGKALREMEIQLGEYLK